MPFVKVLNSKCPKCLKSVYAAEERVAGGNKWHEQCFKCGFCGKTLDSTNCSEHESQLYCQNCYSRKFGPKGYGFAVSMETGTLEETQEEICVIQKPRRMSKAPDGEGCPRCDGHVYAAEQMLARGRGYHRRCFKCLTCNRTLDSTIHCDGPDKEIYCKGCYAIKYGSRGYGHSGISSLGLMSDAKDIEWQCEDHAPKTTTVDTAKIMAPPGEGCPRCGGAVFAAEQMLSKGREWHRMCFNCRDCSKTLDSRNACDGPDNDVYCQTCYGKKWGPHGYGFSCGSGFLQTDEMRDMATSKARPFASVNTTSIKAPEGQGCPRCGGAVFAAELQLAKGREWHKKCYKCKDCRRPLDSTNACDAPDKEIYCRACYGKLYGPKGFGYGHNPTLSTNGETTAKPTASTIKGTKPSDGTGCPRCGYTVYAAEQMVSKSKLWHKRCFTCSDCHRSLDSTNLNDAANGEIYCRGCYGRLFGPRGVGFGMGAGILTVV